ncbi:hypothetical protein SAICODRAFT_67445 [Saitoella complicata NRRL Y-17804]|uniref:Sulfite efflux pump SSU1 n=1 Tax=Saitoella complicata (strain BCRC 22490 / CBS 7301 / JCM 7358 / NBRC 10748 / NRRL Y-17804) TaxID=698492 RepID=A0A0E9NGB1_SAICN|nr:uncharacterized protein SAICODRAFT_67445 [Saitoella complicata NRRL Y-17804]ODQ50942.1 hypothetical protein SAICODRAFT_67445 [Saitoella complicata NRRL Y-17804]GAO48435.1 hypothetical protein G7K_2608-t1 [Saitoella complicata NRRL Y-17804]
MNKNPSTDKPASGGAEASNATVVANKALRDRIKHFTPSWFSITMGTGIVSILLHQLPYQFPGLHVISTVIYLVNVILFVIFSVISIARYTIYPYIGVLMLKHPVQSMILGTVPMGLSTIVNMTVFVAVQDAGFGAWSWKLAWSLWWFDAIWSLLTCLGVPFLMISVHQQSLEKMTAVVLLPIVSTIVAAASGGVVAQILPRPHAVTTLVASYILWGTGIPLALSVIVLYLHRLTIYKLPSREVIVSTFLPLGPLGQGAFGLMKLGSVAKGIGWPTQSAGEIYYTAGLWVGLIMWGYGLVWLVFASGAIVVSLPRFPFNMGWWGFTFPLGVYTLATTTLGNELDLGFFRVLGTIFSCVVVLLWIVVTWKTLSDGVFGGKLFVSPCVMEDEKERLSRRQLNECGNGVERVVDEIEMTRRA